MASGVRRVPWRRIDYDEGSIHGILVANPSKRLYTHPIEWTPEHLDLLNCEVHPLTSSSGREAEARPVQIEMDVDLPGAEWDNILDIVADIRRSRMVWEKDMGLHDLVVRLCQAATGVRLNNKRIDFRYNSRIVANLRIPCHFDHKQQGQRCILTYMDTNWCGLQRRRFHLRRKRSVARAKREVRRANEFCLDPLYIAVTIALAQKAMGASIDKEPLSVSIFSPRHRRDGLTRKLVTGLTQYTAIVTREYLQKFDDPYHFSDSALHVHQTSWGLDQLPALFIALQGASGVSHSLETPLPSPAATTKKRKALDDITGSPNQAPRVHKQIKGR